jgi:putative sigma-54 modulation protein
MIITVTGRQMTVRDSLKETIEKKLHKFDKFFDDDTQAFVTCKARKGVKIIELTVTYGGTLFRSEEENDTFLTALDRAMESFERQIRKNKTRLEKKVKSGAFLPKQDEPEEDEYLEEGEFIIRTKTYPFKPMSPEEAILQMNLLEHSFFVFSDAESGDTCVVYRRKDGNYGLIVPSK